MLGVDETCFFAEVRIWYGHLEHLVGERFGIVIFLHDSEDQGAFPSRDPNFGEELGVYEWVKLDEVVLCLIFWNSILLGEAYELLDMAVISLDLDDQQEGAALLKSVLWFTSGENEQLIFIDKSCLDVEIVDVNILLTEPVPFALEWFAGLSDTLVNRTTNLEARLVEVSLYEDGDGLVLLILDIDLLGDQVECWKLTGFGPRICFEVKHCCLFFFCSTDEENLGDLVVNLLRRNAWSSHLFWRFTERLENGVFSLNNGHFETFLENHGVLERENQILEFGELDDILWQDVAILLHNVLVLVLLIFPKFLEVKDLLNLVDGFVGENVLVVMTPLIFFKIYLSDRCSIGKMESV